MGAQHAIRVRIALFYPKLPRPGKSECRASYSAHAHALWREENAARD
ncbi:MAG: hypothetical protein LBQ75_09630 [Zoogloeaceae bacterium]|nr:hypothetical protein [Zoogloeaceae bacterium]